LSPPRGFPFPGGPNPLVTDYYVCKSVNVCALKPLFLIISNVYGIPYVPYPSSRSFDGQMRNCKIACTEMKVPYDFLVEEEITHFFVVKHRINQCSVFLITKPYT
jgi:hypothetical protein